MTPAALGMPRPEYRGPEMPWGSAYNGGSLPTTATKGGWGSAYAGGSGSTDPWNVSGGAVGSDPFNVGGAAKQSSGGGGGGFFHRLVHVAAQKAELAAHDVKAIPGGLYQTVKVGGNDAIALAENAPKNDPRRVAANNLGNAILHGAVETVKHPLRDPFQTATLLLPVVHGAASGALRAGAAADAVRAGDAAGAAKALARKPVTAPRLLSVGDTQTPLHPSDAPAMRIAQGLYDKVLQRGIDKNPEGRVAAHAMRRVAGSLAETARYQQRLREVPATALDHAAKRLSPTGGRVPGTTANKLQRVEQAALELTSINTTPRDASLYHLKQAADGVEPKQNLAVARLYQAVEKRGLLTQNENGDVVVHAAHPKLMAADVRLAKVQGRGDEILARYGVRTPEVLQGRVDNPGRIRAGAEYVNPTNARLGKPSPNLEAMRGYVDRLQADHARAAERLQRLDFSAADQKRIGPLSAPSDSSVELRQRLAPLEKELRGLTAAHNEPANGLLEERAALHRLLRLGTDASKAVDAFASQAGTEGGVAGLDELKAQADALTEKIQTARGVPSEQLTSLRGAVNSLRSQLRKAEAPRSYLMTGDRPYVTTPKGEIIRPHGSAREEGLSAALSHAKTRLAQMEAAASRRIKPTGIVGGETARPGRGFVSYAAKEPRAPKSPAASAIGPVVGEAQSPISTKVFTGSGIEKGLVPNDVTGQAARHFRGILKFQNTSEVRKSALTLGSDTRRTSRDILVKIPGETHEKIPTEVEQLLGKSRLTTDDANGIYAALDAYRQELIPGLKDAFAEDKAQPIGQPAPAGHRWVDQLVLGDLAKPRMIGGRGRVARGVDSINSAVTAATVYFKIGHVGTRVLTNAATNIIQGSATPLQIAKSADLWKGLDYEYRAKALAAAGQHGIAAMPHEGVNHAARIASKGANWWAKHADAPFRFNSIAYEARKAGFDTPAKFKGLLDKLENPSDLTPEEFAKIDRVAKEANREGIAYDRLNEAERRFVTRALWFYPWLKGASVFAGRTLFEHPVKAGILGPAGGLGRQTQGRQLGDLPTYEQGLFQVKGGTMPLVADFSTFSPFATPADFIQALVQPRDFSNFLNPVGAAGTHLAFGLNSYGQPTQSPYLAALQTLLSPTPEYQIGSDYVNRNKDQSRHMFPHTPLQTVERTVGGPGLPRRLNLPAAHSTAARERSGR